MATPEKPQHTPENLKDSITNSVGDFFSEIVRETKKFLSYLWEKMGILTASRENQSQVLAPWYDADIEKNQKLMEDPREVKKFITKVNKAFEGKNIEQGIEIKNQRDVEKMIALFAPIFNFKESSITLTPGDVVAYNDDRWEIHIGKPDKTTHKVITSDGDIKITNRPIRHEPTSEETVPAKNPSNADTPKNTRLGNFLKRNGPVNTGANSCGRAVHTILANYGMKNVPRWNGNQWQTLLTRDPRFVEVPVNSLADIPAGGIMCYDGKWTINGKPHGSKMNQQYGHVEIADGHGKYYSFYASTRPGGSAKAPSFEEDFEKWKKATGFTGVFVPKSNA